MLYKRLTSLLKCIGVLALISVVTACSKSGDTSPTPDPDPTPPPLPPAVFAKGADISWVTEMEASGRKFFNASGVETECFALMKSLGMNTIRLRVWVNPNPAWNHTADVVAKALRAKNAGMRVLINFHYSDSWADPGKQTKPAAWASLSLAALRTEIGNHTKGCVECLEDRRGHAGLGADRQRNQ
jgi:arabinogalactan endo-1,4-beta-galactosidase